MHVEHGHFILTAHVPITFRSRTILQELGKPVYMHCILRIQANVMLSNYKINTGCSNTKTASTLKIPNMNNN